jgi:hypothetical protein
VGSVVRPARPRTSRGSSRTPGEAISNIMAGSSFTGQAARISVTPKDVPTPCTGTPLDKVSSDRPNALSATAELHRGARLAASGSSKYETGGLWSCTGSLVVVQ